MSTRARPFLVAALVLVLAGCVTAGGQGYRAQAPTSTAATVLRSEQIVRSPSIIHAIASRMPGIRVASGGRCPEITLRGRKSVFGDNNPAVYVDGTRAVNTCILDMLQVLDVDRVEVYPSGVPPRLPYQGNPNGLILVFMVTGVTD